MYASNNIMQYYAASEYRAWTLFYAVRVLLSTLPSFSEALWLLLQSTTSLEDTDIAERLLQ